MQIPIKIKRFHPEARLPVYSTVGAAGFDLFALESCFISYGESKSIRLGVGFEIPPGWQIEIRPRSGLSFKTGAIAKNTIGTIDSDYRGEVRFILHNLDKSPWGGVSIKKGERVCQGVLMPAPRAEFVEVEEFSETDRGSCGFGSTGK